jgi:hypothetical protein
MYRISCDGQELFIVETIKAIMSAIRSSEPGRYVIDEINHESPPTGDIVRPWGIGTRWADGTVEVEPELWLEPPGRD